MSEIASLPNWWLRLLYHYDGPHLLLHKYKLNPRVKNDLVANLPNDRFALDQIDVSDLPLAIGVNDIIFAATYLNVPISPVIACCHNDEGEDTISGELQINSLRPGRRGDFSFCRFTENKLPAADTGHNDVIWKGSSS